MNEKIVKIANTYGYETQALMLIEEMSELTKAICKFNRTENRVKGDCAKDAKCGEVIENLKEEIADVQIMIYQMQYLIHMPDEEMTDRMDAKIDRQIGRINNKQK